MIFSDLLFPIQSPTFQTKIRHFSYKVFLLSISEAHRNILILRTFLSVVELESFIVISIYCIFVSLNDESLYLPQKQALLIY